MARNTGAAGMLFGGIPLGDSSAMEAVIASLVAAGIRAFLFPGALLAEPGRLAALAAMARARVESAGQGEALLALGGGSFPGFGQPFLPGALFPLGLAALGSRPAARRSGRFLGEALAACGIDMALGPRLDLASDPKDPSGALDRFGDEPEPAGSLAAAFLRGMASEGTAACVGRFPGLGSICVECFDGMAFVGLPAERLREAEMRPFARAVRAGAAAVLVGRALVPALEPERIPAARSARVIEGRLREELGFKGLVVGDDIGPEADPSEAALLGALAGCDLCLACRPEEALAAAAALEAAAASGRLPFARVAIARSRLERFLAARPRRRATSARAPAPTRRDSIERDRAMSLTLLKGELSPPPGRRLVLAFLPPPGCPEAAEIPEAAAALRARLPGAEILFLPADPSPAEAQGLADRLSESAGAFSSAVALTYDAHFRPSQEGLARLLEEAVPDFSVVAMRDPYDAAFFPRARGLAAAYGFTAGGMDAVARLLSGELSPRGSCPVGVIGLEV